MGRTPWKSLSRRPYVPGTPPLRRRRETLALWIVRTRWLARGRTFCLRPDPPADASDAVVFLSLCASSSSFSSSRRCRFSAKYLPRHRPRRLPSAFGAGRSRRDASREVWLGFPSAFAGRAVLSVLKQPASGPSRSDVHPAATPTPSTGSSLRFSLPRARSLLFIRTFAMDQTPPPRVIRVRLLFRSTYRARAWQLSRLVREG